MEEVRISSRLWQRRVEDGTHAIPSSRHGWRRSLEGLLDEVRCRNEGERRKMLRVTGRPEYQALDSRSLSLSPTHSLTHPVSQSFLNLFSCPLIPSKAPVDPSPTPRVVEASRRTAKCQSVQALHAHSHARTHARGETGRPTEEE